MLRMIATGTLALVLCSAAARAQSGPYSIQKTAIVGGDGGFDYVYADSVNRRLYVPRSAQPGATPPPRIAVFDLDTLAPAGEIPGFSAHGTVVDPKSGHGFATSKPVVMFDAKSLAVIKSIDVAGNPDGILFDPFNQRVYILSHAPPNMTVIDAASGNVVGTIDLGAAPEQAATDGAGQIYVDLEDKGQVGVIDAKTMTVTARYDLGAATLNPAGLALDAKNHILFAACRNPAEMVILDARTGRIITTLPIGTGVDGAGFNPTTMEAFTSQGDGTLTVVKENSPTSFAVEQTVQTKVSAKTMTIDSKTGRILLIAADYGPLPAADAAAPPLPAGRVRRGPMLPDSFTLIAVGK
jgi:DNA-binding beta-propeller fold protein YncE